MSEPPLELLYEQSGLHEPELPADLTRLYGGGLGLVGPCVLANFVQTLDGVVAIPALEASNALVADGSEADRFVMGLLRAFANVVLVGSGTLRASPRGTWRPERVYPQAAAQFAALRRARGLAGRPAVAIVTTGASLDSSHPILEEGAIVLTLEQAAAGLRKAVPSASEIVAVNDGARVDLRRALALLHERGHELILSEAGPTTFGELVDGGLVDELFLTVSPVLAGRGAGGRRLALVEGVELMPGSRPRAELLSARRAGAHLFLRYRLDAKR